MKKIIVCLSLLSLFVAQGVRADPVAASACAAALQPHARLVFDSVTANTDLGMTLREKLEATVRELVFMDRLMRNAARPAAEAASACLRIALNCTGESC